MSQHIAVLTHGDLGHKPVAPTTRRAATGVMPYGIAGVAPAEEDHDVICTECSTTAELAGEIEGATVITRDAERDYPGARCDSCGMWLDTYVVVYEDGPGAMWFRKVT